MFVYPLSLILSLSSLYFSTLSDSVAWVVGHFGLGAAILNVDSAI